MTLSYHGFCSLKTMLTARSDGTCFEFLHLGGRDRQISCQFMVRQDYLVKPIPNKNKTMLTLRLNPKGGLHDIHILSRDTQLKAAVSTENLKVTGHSQESECCDIITAGYPDEPVRCQPIVRMRKLDLWKLNSQPKVIKISSLLMESIA